MTAPRRRGRSRGSRVAAAALFLGATAFGAPEATPEQALSPVAVLPFENLTGGVVPLAEIRQAIVDAVQLRGIRTLDEESLELFMARHRMRDVGGISADLARKLADETGTAAVLACAVELFADEEPPRIALHARLIATGENPSILWVDGVAFAGHESFGFFGIKRVQSVGVLLARATARIADSLRERIETGEFATARRRPAGTGGKFRPDGFHSTGVQLATDGARLRVAVLPFANETERLDAGRLLTLQFVRELAADPGVDVIDPGEVRETLLRSRLILPEGPSLAQTDLLHALLAVDLVVSGTATEYDEPQGEWGDPTVAFFAQAIHADGRKVDWTAVSHSRGGERVFFFGAGRVATAHELANRMVRQVVARVREARAEAGGAAPAASTIRTR